MLRDIIINNFKGISKAEIYDLKQFNVFVGKNNTRKSTLLEALFFLKAALKPMTILQFKTLNNILQRRGPRDDHDIKRFWYNQNIENNLSFSLIFDNASINVECNKTNDEIKYDFTKSLPTSYGAPFHFSLSTKSNKTNCRILDYEIVTSHGIVDIIKREVTKHLLVPDAETAEFYEGLYECLNYLANLMLVDCWLIRDIERVETVFFGNLIRKGKYKELINILNNSYGLALEEIFFVPYSLGKFKLFLITPNVTFDIDDLCDGARHSLCLFLIAINLRNTAILLEEPEVHQSPKALNSIIQHLIKLARSNALQLIVTTHSPDIVRIFSRIGKNQTNIYHLQCNHEGVISYSIIDPSEAISRAFR